jgi:hypothetical protein
MAQATGHAALIVAHGAPSAPEGPERVMRGLAGAVAALLPGGWAVRGATLAAPGAVAAALEALGAGGRLLVYPHFMADGWFSTEELPRRLRAAGARDFDILPAFGLDPAVPWLCLRRAGEAVRAGGHGPGEVALLLAAHGSPSDPRPAAAALSIRRPPWPRPPGWTVRRSACRISPAVLAMLRWTCRGRWPRRVFPARCCPRLAPMPRCPASSRRHWCGRSVESTFILDGSIHPV